MSDSLYHLSLPEGVTTVALGFLKAAKLQVPHLDNPDEPEALHDFRVALRRLRSCLKAYRDYPECRVGKKRLKSIKALARTTNPPRDSEVMLQWVQGKHDVLDGDARQVLERWETRLQQETEQGYADAIAVIRKRFPSLYRKLKRKLKKMRRRASSRQYGEETLVLLAKLDRELVAQLHQAQHSDKPETLHRARIIGKQVRYLITPLEDDSERVKTAVSECKQFQDLLGDINDAHVRQQALIAHGAEEVVAYLHDRVEQVLSGNERERLDPVSSLLTLLTMNQDELEQRRQQAQTYIDKPEDSSLQEQVMAVIQNGA